MCNLTVEPDRLTLTDRPGSALTSSRAALFLCSGWPGATASAGPENGGYTRSSIAY